MVIGACQMAKSEDGKVANEQLYGLRLETRELSAPCSALPVVGVIGVIGSCDYSDRTGPYESRQGAIQVQRNGLIDLIDPNTTCGAGAITVLPRGYVRYLQVVSGPGTAGGRFEKRRGENDGALPLLPLSRPSSRFTIRS